MKKEGVAPAKTINHTSEKGKNNTETINRMFEMERKSFSKPIILPKTFCT
jgi:hypothetical protein